MFNSTTYVKTVVHSSTHIQQVSGSLIKTHPDSTFIRFDKGSPMEDEVFDIDPKLKVYVGYKNATRDGYTERDVTVLQVLLAHDDSYVCEVVIHYQPGDAYYKASTEEEQN